MLQPTYDWRRIARVLSFRNDMSAMRLKSTSGAKNTCHTRLSRDALCVAVGIGVAVIITTLAPSVMSPSGSAVACGRTLEPWRSKQLDLVNEWVAGRSQVFIFAEVGEQLGKACYHINDVFELCARHHRTCVLPRFYNGHVHLDGAVDFGDVYDLSTLPSGMATIDWRTFADNLFRVKSPNVLVCVFGKQMFFKRRLAAFERVFKFYSNNATILVNDGCLIDEMAGLVNDSMAAQRHSDQIDHILTRPATANYDVVAFFTSTTCIRLEPRERFVQLGTRAST